MTALLTELEPTTKRKDPTLTVRLTADVVKSARIVAAYEDEEMTCMLSDILRPILAKMEAEGAARRAASSPTPKPKPKGGK